MASRSDKMATFVSVLTVLTVLFLPVSLVAVSPFAPRAKRHTYTVTPCAMFDAHADSACKPDTIRRGS